jgi:putative DNA primase/helicase
MLPEGIRTWLADIAERACLPLEMLAVPALVGLSGLVGRSVAIKPREYSDWLVVPNLWGAIVAPPGAKKSDAMTDALRPLAHLEAKAREAHKKATLEAKAEHTLLEAQLSGMKAKARKGGGSRDELAALMGRLEALEALPQRRYTTQDATVEKLGELLRDNPRGITLVRDELASWIASMELQENVLARGFFLSAWNGTSGYTFDRIGRGTVHIPGACVAVLGGIQPQPLEAVFARLRSDPTRADGLLQRLQLIVWPDALPPWNPPQSWPNKTARERAFEVFARLDGLEFQAPDGGEPEPHLLRFTPEAKQAFAEWHDAHEHRLREPKLAETPHFAAHVAKYGSLAASLAVLFHLVEVATMPTRWVWGEERWSLAGEVPLVGLESVIMALNWVDFLEEHARKVYGAELNGPVLDAHALAEQVKQGTVTDGQTVREIQRASRRWRDDKGRLDEALVVLERLGWLKVVELEAGPLGGRPSEVLRLHPTVRRES